MNNSNLYILNFEKPNLKFIVNNFIEKIKNIINEEKLQKFFIQTIKFIDSLIDICIKNKISYFIENNISFTSIIINFKLELENIILEIIKKKYPNIEIALNNFFEEDFKIFNNVHNLNEFLQKSNLNIPKNKVTFSNTASEYVFKNEENKKIDKKNIKSIKINFIDEKKELSIDSKLSILIRILFIDEESIEEFKKKLINICKIINDVEIEYDIMQPYKKE